MEGDDICLTDSGTTHVILKSKEYFLKLTLNGENIIRISKFVKLIKEIWLIILT